MLGWSTKRVAKLVDEALRGAPAGPIGVVGEAGLAKALAAPGRDLRSELGGEATLAAVVAVGSAPLDGLTAALVEGGVVVLVDKEPPAATTRRLLCAALHDLEQRAAGKVVVTSARLRRLV